MRTDRKNRPQSVPEVWAGIECTINRVGQQYFDQLEDAGCYERSGDIGRLAAIGVRTLRFPVLWEKHEPVQEQPVNWSWTDERMREMREAGIQPIIGLLHHGSGPAYTNLADPKFPELFAAYAGKVAQRYPWAEMYTPVNEPLTTARFSGLYGLWYPHEQNDTSFCRMLVNQVKATVLAMKAIRTVNPSAKLVQTEDLARIHSTPQLRYQRNFENERRWLSYDLLCGRVDRKHPLWRYLMQNGIKPEELNFLRSNPCPPDIAGFNYYVTSERYLDHRIKNYPAQLHGGNGKHVYVDIEAVRAGKSKGVAALLREAWERYRLPLALTEVHLGCTREEQLRWFRDIWHAVSGLASKGVTIKAITLWSALGSFDWNSLLTQKAGVYEAGAFDVRGGMPRGTALSKLVAPGERSRILTHPAVQGNGWWEPRKRDDAERQPLLIIGKSGTLAYAFSRMCQLRNIRHLALGRNELDILDTASVEKMMDTLKPWAVINTAGYVRIDEAEKDPAACFALNTDAPAVVAAICSRVGIPFMSFSSDQVFGGDKHTPYIEGDATGPLNVYGRSKALAEQRVSAAHPDALIIRTSAFFGPWDRGNFAWHILEQIRNSGECAITDPGTVSPTYVPDLVQAALDLLIDEERGIWHISNEGAVSWMDFAKELAARGGCQGRIITPAEMDNNLPRAVRPAYSALGSEKGVVLPPLEKAMEKFFMERCC